MIGSEHNHSYDTGHAVMAKSRAMDRVSTYPLLLWVEWWCCACPAAGAYSWRQS